MTFRTDVGRSRTDCETVGDGPVLDGGEEVGLVVGVKGWRVSFGVHSVLLSTLVPVYEGCHRADEWKLCIVHNIFMKDGQNILTRTRH